MCDLLPRCRGELFSVRLTWRMINVNAAYA